MKALLCWFGQSFDVWAKTVVNYAYGILVVVSKNKPSLFVGASLNL